MAGKSRQPSHEPPRGGRKQLAPVTLILAVERKGGTGEGRQPPRNSHGQENANAQKTQTKTPTKLLQRPMNQEHEKSWHMCISNKPLTAKVKLVLLVVNSVKVHLTASIFILRTLKKLAITNDIEKLILTAFLIHGTGVIYLIDAKSQMVFC